MSEAPLKLPLRKVEQVGKGKGRLYALVDDDGRDVAYGLTGKRADFMIAVVNAHADLVRDRDDAEAEQQRLHRENNDFRDRLREYTQVMSNLRDELREALKE